jgi:hypothetical protein
MLDLGVLRGVARDLGHLLAPNLGLVVARLCLGATAKPALFVDHAW